MSDFRFANPQWSQAFWLVIGVAALLAWLQVRRTDALSRFLSVAMQGRLVHRLSPARRWVSLGCFALAAAALVIALMRPQWGLTHIKTPRVGAQIMFCLDVSKSMLAEDTAPNRLERAKAEVTDLLSFLEGDQVGLIAFAGRASVLCPLTPDYSFFNLILDGANPNSVGRGGTRLETPIRKALDGFRSESGVSRIIVLITDGEDHDSHPLDAAKVAAERGVKILAIGFGDEAGSQVHITDERTGVRSVLTDGSGQPVVTRLDGQTLREMALATEGAYIPAGTGALDLKSIYDAHIAPLVRGEIADRGRTIRNEGFQWAVLAGMLLLFASVVAGASSVKSKVMAPPQSSATKSMAAALLFVLLLAWPSHAQVNESQPHPRDTYNEAVALLDEDLDGAEEMLTEARRKAGADGDVRFRATYNMGWVEVKRADEVIEKSPEEALARLRRAADWFRDAVRLRPDFTDARHNLEVVMRRILELTDALAQKKEQDLAKRLDALIETQRGLVATTRQLVQRIDAASDTNAVDGFRSDFRHLAVEQRKILSESQAVAKQASEELEALQVKKDNQRSPQENLRAAQLGNLRHYMQRAGQRLGQARSQMRRRQAERAFRRAAIGLTELKRARDQLRGPVESLDAILQDAKSLTQSTALKSVAGAIIAEADGQRPQSPSWLTGEYLKETQQSVTERTQELVSRLSAGLTQEEQSSAIGPPTAEDAQKNEREGRFLKQVAEAVPFLEDGLKLFQSAGQAISAERYDEAGGHQVEALTALRDARERFLQLRGLIELAYAREVEVQSALASSDADESPAANAIAFAGRQQEKNLDRAERIAQLIEDQLRDRPFADEPSKSAGNQQASAQREQLEAASRICPQVIEEMKAAAEQLATSDKSSETSEPSHRLKEAQIHVDKSVELLQSLRRLFFSIVEHLQETARRQAQLNDETEQVAGLQDEEGVANKAGPLELGQKELESITGQIAQSLAELGKQPPSDPAGGQKLDPQQRKQTQQNSEKFAQAAELVEQGEEKMQAAADSLSQADAASARAPQDEALQKLTEALTLLQPPQQNQNNQQQQEQQQQQQSKQGKGQQQQQEAQGMDAARLLQAVRDREAKRRREQERRRSFERDPVDKDW